MTTFGFKMTKGQAETVQHAQESRRWVEPFIYDAVKAQRDEARRLVIRLMTASPSHQDRVRRAAEKAMDKWSRPSKRPTP